MRHAARVDDTQSEIVAALRQVGATVEPIHTVGRGVPDLLVAFRGQNYLLEVKTGNGRLTPDERRWHEGWGAPVHVVRDWRQALKVIGAME